MGVEGMRMDRHGWILPEYDIDDGMMFPVKCAHCHNGVYDLASVTVTARYTDCSVWKSPCCGQVVDDRKPPWTYRAHYEDLR